MDKEYSVTGNNPGKEWYQTVYDQKVPRTALLTEIDGRLHEIILDESGLASGAGVEINPKSLKG